MSRLNIRLPFREDAVFGIVGFMVFSIPLAFTIITYEKFETIKLALWLFFLALAAALFLKQKYNGPRTEQISENLPKIKFHKGLSLAVGIFWIWALLASVFSWDRLNSFLGFYPRFTNGLLFYTLWAVFILLVVAVINRERFIFLLKILCFDLLIISVFGIMQSMGFAFYEGLDASGFLRAPSMLGNANFASMFVVSILPVALYLFWSNRTLVGRIYYGLCLFSGVSLLVVLSSRGSWVAFVGSFICLLILAAAYRLPKAFAVTAVAMLVLAGGLWYATLQYTRPTAFTSVINLTDTNANLRFFVWDIARTGIKKYPIFGTGLGNFQLLFQQERGSNLAKDAGVYDDSHNLFLQFATTGGVILLLAFLAILALAVWSAYRSIRQDRGSQGPLFIALISSIVAFCIAASFTPVVIPCFLVLALLLVGCCEDRAKEYEFYFSSIMIRNVGMFISFVFMAAAISFFSAEYLFAQAYSAYFQNNFTKSLSLSNLAIKLNPTNQYYYIYRAGSLAQLGKIADAEAEVRHMIAMHPREARSYISAVNIYYPLFVTTGKKEYIDAMIDYMKQSIQHDYYYSSRFATLGVFYYFQGDLKNAYEYSKTSLTLNEDYLPSWMLLARIYQIQDKKQQMIYALQKAFDLRPDIRDLKVLVQLAKTVPDFKNIPIPVGYAPATLE